MKKENWIVFLIFSLLSLALCAMAFEAFSRGNFFTAVVFIFLAFVSLLYDRTLMMKRMRETEKIILSIRQKDFSLFPKEQPENNLLNNAVRLYYQAKKERSHYYSYKNLYETILDKLETGFMILSRENSQPWKVFYCNHALLDILKIPKYNEWEFYREKIPAFFELIENSRYQDSQDFIDLSVQERSRHSFSVRTSRISAYRNDFFIISMESIQKIIDKKEKQAWNNLMKVISHELLNTLTPVNSLIQNLEYLTKQEEELTPEDQADIRESLKIIKSKSQQLLHFIDSYRQVAELPRPNLTHFSLKNLAENVLKLFAAEFSRDAVVLSVSLDETNAYADEKMIERVMINLISNAYYAVYQQKSKKIALKICEQNRRIIFSIQDNGGGIDPKIGDRIFLPFFTTRDNGSGIGLTLAKSIMEAHHGYLTYKNSDDGALFEAWLIR